MINKKLSVIIPVYNSEKYLEKCIESIIQQTYEEWELILVDDGSSDSSWEIISKYASKDKRVIGIKQENKGPGLARNSGLLKATGEYVVFVDSDDYIDSNYFSLIIKHSGDNDLLFIDVVRVDENGKAFQAEKLSNYKTWQKDRIIRSTMTGKIPWGGVRKVVRRNVLIDNQIFYSDLKVGEEALFSFKSLYFSKTYGFIDEKPVYMYVQRNNSQSSYGTDDPWGGTFNTIKKYLEQHNLYEKYADTLNALNVSSTLVSIDRMTSAYADKKECKLNIKNRIKRFKEDLDRRYNIDSKNLDKKAKFLLPFLLLSLSFPIVVASKLRRRVKKNKK